jgi:hypothetical protein
VAQSAVTAVFYDTTVSCILTRSGLHSQLNTLVEIDHHTAENSNALQELTAYLRMRMNLLPVTFQCGQTNRTSYVV